MANRTLLTSLTVATVLALPVLALTAEKKKSEKPDISKLPAPASKPGLTFDKDIKPIIEKSCLKCHSGDKPKSKYRVESRETFIKGGESGDAAVIAGKSADSPVVHYVCGLVEDMEMPPTDKRDKYPALTKDQIGLLRAWIDQGAK